MNSVFVGFERQYYFNGRPPRVVGSPKLRLAKWETLPLKVLVNPVQNTAYKNYYTSLTCMIIEMQLIALGISLNLDGRDQRSCGLFLSTNRSKNSHVSIRIFQLI